MSDIERVWFQDVSVHRAAAEALFETLKARLLALIPQADIQHVGSTALPHGQTKGDLDIQVRVTREVYVTVARDALAGQMAVEPGAFHGPDAISYKDDATTPPVGIHITVMGGACDFQWKFREVLVARPDLCDAYDDIKRRFEGGDMAAYREAKNAFFEMVAATPEYQALSTGR